MTDTHAATELKLYIDNDGDLYRRQTTSILKNLATKKARGQYKRDLAVRAFAHLVEAGAKKYASGSDQPWHVMFDVGTRKQAAGGLVADFESEYALGNYEGLLPKKYQKPVTEGSYWGDPKVRARVDALWNEGKKSQHSRVKAPAKKLKWQVPEGLRVVWAPVNQAYMALWPGRGPVKDQQVLKVASADAMHTWLQNTYGEAYGVAGRTPQRHHATILTRSPHDFRGHLRSAMDRQLQGIYEEEKQAGRHENALLVYAEAARRGVPVMEPLHVRTPVPFRVQHSSKKSPAQLQREIDGLLGRRQ